jgi:multiple sugar transport system permease protein
LAAKVDGCSDRKYLVKTMVPIAKSSIITIVILKLMGAWNAFIWPDIVANEKFKLVTTWLRTSFTDQEATGVGRVLINYQMAATVIVTVPLLLMFVFFRKYIMSGISRSGLKG